MRQVLMLITISGGRADGRSWPEAGHGLVLSDAEAADLIRGRMAIPHPDGFVVPDEALGELPPPSPEMVMNEPQETAAPARPVPVPEPHVIGGDVELVSVGVGDGLPAPEPSAAEEPPSPPAYAPKPAWVDYAIYRGMPADEANAATKAQLMERYGGRPL